MFRIDVLHPFLLDISKFSEAGPCIVPPNFDVKGAMLKWRYRDKDADRAERNLKNLTGGAKVGEG